MTESPYRRLWCSVILEAVNDIDGERKIERYKKKVKEAKRRSRRDTEAINRLTVYFEDAKEFFISRSREIGSFNWICDVCDLDAERILDMVWCPEGRKRLMRANASIKGGNKARHPNEVASVDSGEGDEYD